MTLPNDADREALERMLTGNPSALLELYDRHAAMIFARAYASLGDRFAAEDVVQETFTAAWFEVRSWFKTPGDVAGWLLEIARGKLADRSAMLAGAAPDVPFALPYALRDRVLDSIYGAGERLRPPYATPQWAQDIRAHWFVWVLAAGELALVFALA